MRYLLISFTITFASCVTPQERFKQLEGDWVGINKSQLEKSSGKPNFVEKSKQGDVIYSYTMERSKNPYGSVDPKTGVMVQKKSTGSRINRPAAYSMMIYRCELKVVMDKNYIVKSLSAPDDQLNTCNTLLKKKS